MIKYFKGHNNFYWDIDLSFLSKERHLIKIKIFYRVSIVIMAERKLHKK